MQMESNRSSSGVPGSAGNAVTRNLLGNNADTGRKKELVVLIRPTVIRTTEDWERTTQQALSAFDEPAGQPRRVITVAPAGAPPLAAPVTTPQAAPSTAPSGTPLAALARH
jgi:MSHA biogenesis protein MshL